MDNELFGERHEQEENGLYGKRHLAELCDLSIVSSSFLLITKEMYSDGVKSIYEDEIKASSLCEAKQKAQNEVKVRNEYLGKYGKCYLVDVRAM